MKNGRRTFLAGLAGIAATSALGRLPSLAVTRVTEGAASLSIDPDLARLIKNISNVFEVGGPEPDYAYVEDLADGRGYTVTQYGFCTYNDEVTRVIRRYAASVPNTPLAHFLGELPPEKWHDQKLGDFPQSWRKEIAASAMLGRACDVEADALFLGPAISAAMAAGITVPVGLAIFYDTLLQHGNGSDPDSLRSIVERTQAVRGNVRETSQLQWLTAFLSIRKSVLENPSNRETRDVWRASVLRVDALLGILKDNPTLVSPIEVVNAETRATIR